MQKQINLATINTKTDCNSLAKAVIEKCELIHPSKLAEIEQLIYYLKKRKPTKGKSKFLFSRLFFLDDKF